MTERGMRRAPGAGRRGWNAGRGPAAGRRLAGGLALLWLLLVGPAAARAESRITALVPASGPPEGGTLVVITVERAIALGPLEVHFGGRVAERVRRRNATTLEVVAPPGPPGPVAVRVLNEFWGTSTAPAVFTYIPPAPRLDGVEPPALPAGAAEALLTLTGQGFTPTAGVRVEGLLLPSSLLAPGRLQVRLPPALLERPRTLEVRVAEAALGGGSSAPIQVAVVNPAPRLAAVEAPPLVAGAPDTPIAVRGRDFRPDSALELGGRPVVSSYRSAEELQATIPAPLLAAAGELTVRVVTPGPGGGPSDPVRLAVAAAPPRLPGRYVVFTSNRREGRNHLFLLDRQTGRLDSLAEANSVAGSDGYPSISADGRWIAFQSDRRGGQHDIFLFDREGRRLDDLPEANHPTAFDGFPALSPDGRFIVFESDRVGRKPKIFLFDLKSRTLSELQEANQGGTDDGLAAISN